MIGLLLCLAATAAPGLAQVPAAPDTTAAADARDTTAVETAPSGEPSRITRVPLRNAPLPARDRPPPPPLPTGWDRPRWVMLRSLALPGWGQLHNGSWWKAAGVAAGEVWLGLRILEGERELDRLAREANAALERNDVELHNDRIEQFNARFDDAIRDRWLLGGVVIYALLDAYIDAHFKNFDVQFDADPALPPGPASPGGRVSVGWRF
ncbi:MAG TPA: DUF5683 domain-containing protein [Candidatus Limnocylindria bacterium]|nr:DUF5683 domain-containing protein [Candidatus Limnocylindria bacterium]